MPGFLGGGGSSSSGTGGEIRFPKEFIDPVTKLRISQPENLIDTDFEYGLQPTKWETVELINNTPSFFSKSGDTTIPGIVSISTNTGTREITVVTTTDHGLAVGIPINVTGTKSVTADGAYIINSIPNGTTFTYLCKDEQNGNNAIEDLYTSIITGEFFQGSQIRIADAEGITTDAEPVSTLTVKTDSTHGFGLNTPFYFLNLNSTISQEFEASNTSAKSFDSSNSATAQTFDGSNTLSTFNIDWSNSAVVGGAVSTITGVNTTNDTIAVTHGTENFANQPLGTPLYYNLTVPASTGYFFDNPRGVVFLKTTNSLNVSGVSTFQVSATPDGDAIDIVSSMSGTMQLANQARTFAGNNRNPATEVPLTVLLETPLEFDGGNQGYVGAAGSSVAPNGSCTILGFTATDILVSVSAGAGLDYYIGAMVRYSTSGAAATGLTNNTTYFISYIAEAGPNLYNIRLKGLPTDASSLTPSGGSGSQTFAKIGVSVDKDIFHVKNSNFVKNEMLQYAPPSAGANFVSNYDQKFYFVETVYDNHNFTVNESTFIPITATGGTILPNAYTAGRFYKVHAFTTVGTSTFQVQAAPSGSTVEYLIVGGGGGGGSDMGGGGGGGGVLEGTFAVSATSYSIVVGDGGLSSGQPYSSRNSNSAGLSGESSSAFSVTALGGAGGAGSHDSNVGPARTGGSSGGGASGQNANASAGTAGQGFAGGTTGGQWYSGGGGGAGSAGSPGGSNPQGGNGKTSSILGPTYWFGGGGAGSGYTQGGGTGGRGGGGGGGRWSAGSNGIGNKEGINPAGDGTGNDTTSYGGSGGVNTGGGAGGHAHQAATNTRKGGSGIVVIRYPITGAPSGDYPVASGGSISTLTVGNDIYAVHSFTSVGSATLAVSIPGNAATGSQTIEYMVIGGGGSGGSDMGGGGGAGGYLAGTYTAAAANYAVVVGDGGRGNNSGVGARRGFEGGNSSLIGTNANVVAFGGGGGASNHDRGNNPAGGVNNGQTVGSGGGCSGGGAGAQDNRSPDGAYGGSRRGTGTAGQGNAGGTGAGYWYPGGGGGSAAAGTSNPPRGGAGTLNTILGPNFYWAAGGGGSNYSAFQDNSGGRGGGGGGAQNNFDNRGVDGINVAQPGGYGAVNSQANTPGGDAGTNTGSGGGGGAHYNSNNYGGAGGSGIVVVRYKIGTVS